MGVSTESTFLTLQLTENLFVGREAFGFVFGVDVATVNFNVEDATFALDEFGVDACCVLDRVRQTGGLGRVVSLHTIRDGHVHGDLLQEANEGIERTPNNGRHAVGNIIGDSTRKARPSNVVTLSPCPLPCVVSRANACRRRRLPGIQAERGDVYHRNCPPDH